MVYSSLGPTEEELHLLGKDVSRRRVLEVGCGGGQASIALTKRGAVALGIDISDEQINRAREAAEREGVTATFHQGEADDLHMVPDSSQDIVFSSNVYDYVERLDRAFSEVHRVLIDGGIFVFCVMHPFFRFCRPLLPAANTDSPLLRRHARELVSYHQRGRSYIEWEWTEEGVRIPMYIYRRKVEDFVNTLREARFVIDRIIEPEPSADPRSYPWIAFHPYEQVALVPDTIIFRALKAAAAATSGSA